MSVRDTSRFRAITSFTADSELPPRSKKWSYRPIWSTGTPSNVAHAAAIRCSVGVLGAWSPCSPSTSLSSSSAASAVSAFVSILPLAVSGRLSRQWKADGTMYSGSVLAEPVAQDLDVDRPLPGVEGDQAFAPVGPLGDDHRAVADAGHPQQGVVDLADLDPEPGDLHLAVAAAEELQLAVGPPASVVAALVEPLARSVRVGHVDGPGALRVVDVPAAHADPGERDQAGGAQRHRVAGARRRRRR